MKFNKKYKKLKGPHKSRLRSWLSCMKRIIKSGYYEWTESGNVRCLLCGEIISNAYKAIEHLRRRHNLRV